MEELPSKEAKALDALKVVLDLKGTLSIACIFFTRKIAILIDC